MLKIEGHRFTGADFKRSPNVGGALSKPTAIVLHDTGSSTASSPINWLTNPDSKVSAHVVIGRDGKITQLVPFNVKAWHAGKSKLDGRANCNDFTIGIEIVNPGALKSLGNNRFAGVQTFTNGVDGNIINMPADVGHGAAAWMAYTDEQVEAVIELCRALVAEYPSLKQIVTHWIISPGRKVDTNPLFPLQAVRDAVLGEKTVAPTKKEIEKAKEIAATIIDDATVMASVLNLRGAPGGDVIGKLPNGTRLDVRKQDGDWLQVAVADGAEKEKTGYVAKAYVRLDP